MAIKAKISSVTSTANGNVYEISFYEESAPTVIIGVDNMHSGGPAGDLAVKKYILDKCQSLDADVAKTGNVDVIGLDDIFGANSLAWQATVASGIEAKVQAGTIEKGIIKELDEERKIAVVEVYMFVASDLYNRLYLVYENKNQDFQFERIIQE